MRHFMIVIRKYFSTIVNRYFRKPLFLFLLLFAGLFSIENSLANPASVSLKKIAITQIVAHPSLDKIRNGIVDQLVASGYQEGKTAHFIFANAQGNAAVAVQIAQQFAAEHPDVIIAITTPSAQAVVSATQKTTIPVVFSSITDPIKAKLVTNLEHPGGTVTGTRNASPIGKQIALAKTILPKLQTLGIVINFGEANSVELVDTVTAEAKRQHIAIKTATASSSAEVQTAVSSLMNKVDALLLLQDNTVATALPALFKITDQYLVPVFTTYNDAIPMGALAGISFDEYAIGKQTGKIAAEILSGRSPGDIPVADPADIQFAINLNAAKKLHIPISKDLLKQAQMVFPPVAKQSGK